MSSLSDPWPTIPIVEARDNPWETADIRVTRANLYAHGDCGGDCDGPDPQPLGIGVLEVLLVDGQAVTIAAGVARPKVGGNYIELDVSPDDARRLAHLLMACANDAEATPRMQDELDQMRLRGVFASDGSTGAIC